ncbi:MAG TPA: glycosyltransferase family 4 protein [Stellaceae bacterium]|nr:glycosyltransferase family 4 protein [Stellaceae bacterium]
MRRLLYVVAGRFAAVTGSIVYARRILGELPALGWEATAAEFEIPGPEPSAAAVKEAAALLARAPDGSAVVLDGETLPAFLPSLAAHAGRLRLVALLHHSLAAETGLDAATSERFRAIETAALRAVRTVICPSRMTADTVAGYGVADARIAIVRPGLDRIPSPPLWGGEGQGEVGSAQPVPTAHLTLPLRGSLPLPPEGRRGCVRLLAIGSVIPRKGHALLVEALGGLKDLDWRLTIVGSLDRDAGATAALRHAITAGGVGDRVTLADGHPPERMADYYAAADLFVLASFHEGYGMVYAEAMAYGLPVIATAAGAVPEVVPPAAGALVPPGDRAALQAALRRLIADGELRQRCAAAALAHARTFPEWHESAARFAAALV